MNITKKIITHEEDKREEWEEQFYSKFSGLVLLGGWGSNVEISLKGREKDIDQVRDFIASLLEERTKEITDLAISLRKELTYRPIDEMSYKEKMEEMHAIGWNQGLEEFTIKLRERYL